MKAWTINSTGELDESSDPLELTELPDPAPGPTEIRIKVSFCGMCHTELDEIEGRTPPPSFPVVPGHQIVGYVDALGKDVFLHKEGDRVGVGWIFDACGKCTQCRAGKENLCDDFIATGRDANGGYADFITVPEASAYPIPKEIDDMQAAPLLCAGAIGYRSLMLCDMEDGMTLGLTGFGASAHIVLHTVHYLYPHSRIFVFARRKTTRNFALSLGAVWSGATEHKPPEKLDRIIDTTPAWKPVISALETLLPGGRLVINAIRKEDTDKTNLSVLRFEKHLWMEKEIKSVANITRKDIRDFLPIAAQANILPEVEKVDFDNANKALLDMKFKGSKGARVLLI